MNQNERNPVEELFENFLELRRRGDALTIEEFARQYPDFESQIIELFPAMELLEEIYCPAPAIPRRSDVNHVGQSFGDYLLLREIGRGGMGVVYHARHTSLGKEVAIKVLPEESSSDTFRRRFLREARSAARLHHANIVPVFDFGEHDGRYFYVMQFIRGQSLANLIAGSNAVASTDYQERQRRLTTVFSGVARDRQLFTNSEASDFDSMAAVNLAESRDTLSFGFKSRAKDYWHYVAQVGLQVAEGLEYAHSQKILHRDIKPGNLIVDERGTVWITDFGLAKSDEDDDLTRTGDIVGTMRYLPPESLNGKTDCRSDVCSLGLTLYELASHRPAYSEEDRHKLLRQIVDSNPPPLRSSCEDIPYDLETIIRKSIEREPRDRYRTAGSMADDLRRFINHEPIHARRTSLPGIMARWAKRNPALAITSTTILIGLLLASVISTFTAIRFSSLSRELRTALNLSKRNEQAARAAELESKRQLFEASMVAARSAVTGRKPGQRLETLAAIRRAEPLVGPLGFGADVRFELRNLAVNALSRLDISPAWQTTSRHQGETLSVTYPEANLYIVSDKWPAPRLELRRISDDTVLIKTPKLGKLHWFQFNPASGLLAIAQGEFQQPKTVQAWRLDHDRLVHRFDRSTRHLESRRFFDLTCSLPICACLVDGQTLEIISIETGDVERSFHFPSPVNHVRISPNGEKSLAWSIYGQYYFVVDLRTNEVSERVNSATGFHADFSDDGRFFALTGDDATVELLETETGRAIASYPGRSTSDLIDVHPSGEFIAIQSWDGSIRLLDRSGEMLLALPGRMPRFSMDGDFLSYAQGDKVGYVRLHQPSCHKARAFSNLIGRMQTALLPNGLLVVAGDPEVIFYDLIRDQRLNRLTISGQKNAVVVSPDNRMIMTTGAQGLITWPVNQTDGKCVIGPPSLTPLGFNTDGWISIDSSGQTLAVGGYNDFAILRKRGETFSIQRNRQADFCRQIALSPDGLFVAVGGTQITSVFDSETLKQVAQFPIGAVPIFDALGQRLLLLNHTDPLTIDTTTWNASTSPLLSESIGAASRMHDVAAISIYDPRGVALIDLKRNQPLVYFPVTQYVDERHGEQTAKPEGATFLDENVSVLATKVTRRKHPGRLSLWSLKELRNELKALNLDWDLPPIDRSYFDFENPADSFEIQYYPPEHETIQVSPEDDQIIFEAPYLASVVRPINSPPRIHLSLGEPTPQGGRRYSGETHLTWSPAVADNLTLDVEVPDSGAYTLRISLGKSQRGGIYRVTINGAQSGTEFDFYSPHANGELPPSLDVGSVELESGRNVFTFEVVGKSPKSVGSELAIDFISIEKRKP